MLFRILLYISLTVFIVGSVVRISRWFTRRIGPPAQTGSIPGRIFGALSGIIRTLFSRRILLVPAAVLLDVLLLRRTLKESRARWLAHMLIFYGFMPLILLHALERFITVPLFPEYYSTLNPWLFLRDLFAAMVIAGIALAVYRRTADRTRQRKTGAGDVIALALIAAIIISGILYEGVKISAYSVYSDMVDQYAMGAGDDELAALEKYWVAKNGTFSRHVSPPFSAGTLAEGQTASDNYCGACHAPMHYAFAGFAAAKVIGPAASGVEGAGYVSFFGYLHFILCFIGLAYIPFGKMFHIIATPVHLVAGTAVKDHAPSSGPGQATLRAIAFDACTHCGTCSTDCSARMAALSLENSFVLPSEKLGGLKQLYSLRERLFHSRINIDHLSEGLCVCTNCERCTTGCPSGIDLKDLWTAAREDLLGRYPAQPALLSPLSFVRGLNRNGANAHDYQRPLDSSLKTVIGRFSQCTDKTRTVSLNDLTGTREIVGGRADFSHCFGCRNCTSVCPVVEHYPLPEKALGLLPHQLMTSLGLGLVEAAAGSKMIWDCLSCYQCQEFCPQGVDVCDIIYRLKNLATEQVSEARP